MTEFVTKLIQIDKPFVFVKFGDGEYDAVKGKPGSNCDKDPYTKKLQFGLINAVKYYSLLDNAYCGQWHSIHVKEFFDSIVTGKINWINYHVCIMDETSFENNNKLELFKSIKYSHRKKILVGNELLEKAKYLLNLDEHLIVPYRNWVENEFDTIYEKIVKFFENDPNPMILTCAGMGSKVLIMELHKKFPNGIFIDIGSGLDYLCTKKCSRGNVFTYDKLENYFKEILPLNWNDICFENIYVKSKKNIGIHLPK